MKYALFIFIPLLVFSACYSGGSGFSTKPERQITIEILNSDVVMLDEKEIHISYLETQIEKMASESELKADVTIQSDADIDVIRTTQEVLRRYSSDIVYDSDTTARLNN